MSHHAEVERIISALNVNIEEVDFEVGDCLLPQDGLPENLIYIKEGSARLICTETSHPKSIIHLTPGDMVGLLSLLSTYTIEKNAIADRPIKGLLIKTDSVIDYLKHNPSANNDLCDLNKNLILERLCQKIGKIHADKNWAKKIYAEIDKENTLLFVSKTFQKPDLDKSDYYLVSDNCDELSFGDLIEDGMVISRRGEMPLRIIKLARSKEIGQEEYINISGQVIEDIPNLNRINDSDNALVKNNTNSILARNIGQYSTKKSLPKHDPPQNQKPSDVIIYLIKILSDELDVPYNLERLRRVVANQVTSEESNIKIESIINTASQMGFRCDQVHIDKENIRKFNGIIVVQFEGSPNLVLSINGNECLICNSSEGHRDLLFSDFCTRLFSENESIDAFLLTKRNTLLTNRFSLSAFKPYIKKYKKEIIEILILSFFVQLVGLFGPLMIQQIIDKVVNQRSLSSLTVLGSAMIFLTVFEGLFATTRTFLSSAVANRIDYSLGTSLLTHLLDLPLKFFDKSTVGDLSTRVNEIEKIRSFFTGQIINSILDSLFSIIYIAIMFIYSPLLSIVALSVLPIQALITLIGTPYILKFYKQAAQSNSATQSHLVETLGNMITVKSQNLELMSRWKWQKTYKEYMKSLFRKTQLSSLTNESSKLFQKISQLLVLWVGVTLVLDAKLTLGGLIAFRIISGYVTTPLLRLTTIFQSYQEIQVSLSRIGEIVNRKGESEYDQSLNICMPPIKGDVSFQNVAFRFSDDSKKNVLNNISFGIDAGQLVGIVGLSGSGKSTLTKLICRFYDANFGKIFIDDYDISKVDLYSLRNQIGYVPQSPMLFSGTVKDNICAGIQEPPEKDLVRACRIACAHEFIMELPNGYLSDVGERGANLSGGQMQRIALARTILANPQLLILDEATSALDYKTEYEVFSNIHRELSGITTIYITHRLSQADLFDKILFMDSGTIQESGTHSELIELKGQYYALIEQKGELRND